MSAEPWFTHHRYYWTQLGVEGRLSAYLRTNPVALSGLFEHRFFGLGFTCLLAMLFSILRSAAPEWGYEMETALCQDTGQKIQPAVLINS